MCASTNTEAGDSFAFPGKKIFLLIYFPVPEKKVCMFSKI